jgi:5-methylcytosine-specific restriction endonuclease McrA
LTPEQIEQRKYIAWLRHPVVSPQVWRLVWNEALRHWKECPDDRRFVVGPVAAHRARLRHLTDESYRLYHREKAKRRKAQDRKVWLRQVKASDLRALRARFDGCCAYCGVKCDAEIDHFQPIAKGGTHVLSNLLPACHDCNSSKRDHHPEEWCRRQPWFTEKKWRQLLAVMGKKPANVAQLALI